MVKLKILIFAVISSLSFTIAADIFIGAGINKKDDGESPAIVESFKWEEMNSDYPWFASINHRETYPMYGVDIEDHYILAVGKRIVKWNFIDDSDVFFYLDFGLAATSKLSIANSSPILFYEGIGLALYDFRITLAHTSNGGLVPPNEGETALLVEFHINFD